MCRWARRLSTCQGSAATSCGCPANSVGRASRSPAVPLGFQVYSFRPGGHPYPDERVQHLWAVEAREVDAPSAEEAVRMRLWTSHGVWEPEDALQVLADYTGRWAVERVHHVLKQVVEIERTQLRSRAALWKWIHLATEAAVEIESMMRMAREAPEARAFEHVGREAVMTVQRAAPPLERMHQVEEVTMETFVRWTAMKGGYVDQKGQGPPGSQTLARGWARIEPVITALELGRIAMPP